MTEKSDKGPGGVGVERILNSTNDAVISIDAGGMVIFWNPAAGRMFGYTNEEALGMNILELIPQEYRARHNKGLARFLKTEEPVLIGRTVEVEGFKKKGGRFPMELTLSAQKADEGWVFTAIIRDITERKHKEEELQERSVEQTVLYDISSAMSRTLELDELLPSVLKAVTGLEVFNIMRLGGIFLIEGGRMNLAAHLGHPDDFVKKHRGMKVGECICGIAAETGEVLICGDYEEDKRHTITYNGIEPHGYIIVPLKAKGTVLGVMYLYLPPGGKVEEGKKRLLVSIGEMIGMAIHNARLYEQTRDLSLRDPLTGLANKRLMRIEIERSLSRAVRYDRPLSLIMLDIDNFKEYNDTHGHPAGDKLLVELSRLFTELVRKADLVARYGGEEFIIILPETDRDKAAWVAEKIRKAVEKKSPVTVSLGVAAYHKGLKDIAALINDADTALYKAKKNGRNRVEVAG